jgi:hypothetical protein
LRPNRYIEDFGNPLAHYDRDAEEGKSREGEQNGQEILEEVQEAGSNQAVDDQCSQPKTLK